MIKKFSLKKITLILSFIVALITVLVFFTVSGYTVANKYKQRLENVYSRALNELTDYVNEIKTGLDKAIYSNTSVQQNFLLGKVAIDATSAKNSIAQLPLTRENLDGINKYFTQLEDYSKYLSKNVLVKGTLSQEEKDKLAQFKTYAERLHEEIVNSTIAFVDGDLQIGESISLSNINFDEFTGFGITDNFHDIEGDFTDFPTLIYDGPFSDHMLQKKAKFLENKEEISLDAAKKIASDFSGISVDQIVLSGEIDGVIKCYRFVYGDVEIAVTKSAGVVNYMINQRTVAENQGVSVNDARDIGKSFLEKHNLNDMEEKYYEVKNNICTINYAYTKDQIICYSDLVKVGIAMDTGEVVSFQATGYIMNHHDREYSLPKMSKDQASQSVSSNLNILNSNIAYIPTRSLSEVLCFEFECKTALNETMLVYINADTGTEEQIFKVLNGPEGILVI